MAVHFCVTPFVCKLPLLQVVYALLGQVDVGVDNGRELHICEAPFHRPQSPM